MAPEVTRREWLSTASTLAVAYGATSMTNPLSASEPNRPADEPFGYCLNTSTISGQNLSVVEDFEIAAKAGYQAVEPWLRKLNKYIQQGGSLTDLKKRIDDLGLTVESAIGFAQWIVDDEQTREAGLEEAKRDMDLLAQLGGKRIAAPPAGATKQSDLNLFRAAERYRALLELGQKMGVVPQVEVWGHSACLSRLGETTFVAIESGHPQACILPDVYHIYKGGSDFHGLGLLSGQAVHVFHMNDYPAQPDRATIKDADRVYPGDGVAPLTQILQTLYRNGFRGYLSLELFNPEYWKQDAMLVARTALEKTRQAVRKAMNA